MERGYERAPFRLGRRDELRCRQDRGVHQLVPEARPGVAVARWGEAAPLVAVERLVEIEVEAVEAARPFRLHRVDGVAAEVVGRREAVRPQAGRVPGKAVEQARQSELKPRSGGANVPVRGDTLRHRRARPAGLTRRKAWSVPQKPGHTRPTRTAERFRVAVIRTSAASAVSGQCSGGCGSRGVKESADGAGGGHGFRGNSGGGMKRRRSDSPPRSTDISNGPCCIFMSAGMIQESPTGPPFTAVIMSPARRPPRPNR